MLHKLRLAINGKIPPWAKEGYLKCRQLNAGSRALPDFLILGAQKAGTTSLFNYLCQHPQIIGAVPKEVMFFTAQFDRGEHWYRRHFPKQAYTRKVGMLCGEATPTYLYSMDAAQRGASMLPNAKLIVLLREPASRAVSHYYHQARSGVETRTIDEVFSVENIARWEAGDCPDLHARYYFKWSDYATGLEQWLKHYSREQLLVIEAERMFENPQLVVNQVCEFLQLKGCSIARSEAFNAGEKKAFNPKEMELLTSAFTKQNESLSALGFPMRWS